MIIELELLRVGINAYIRVTIKRKLMIIEICIRGYLRLIMIEVHHAFNLLTIALMHHVVIHHIKAWVYMSILFP